MASLLAKSKKYGNKIVLVDEEDLDRLSKYTWNVNHDVYIRSRESRFKHPDYKQKIIQIHRLIMNINDSKIQVDHINGNKLDNRKCNLRLVNTSQNQMNSTTARSNNKLGVKGVRIHSGKFEVHIWYNNKSHYLGRYTTLEEASNVYDQKAFEVFGEFARLNGKIL